MKKTKLYVVNGILLAVSFGLARVYIWLYLLYCFAMYKLVTMYEAIFLLPKICVCGTVLFGVMNIYWFVKILIIVVKTVRDLLTIKYKT